MELTLIQMLILGLVQGITEWLPISSSGMSTLIMANFFGINDVSFIIHTALFFHLGTFFAALIYFRKDITELLVALFNYKKSNIEIKKILKFLIISTMITGVIGSLLLKFLIDSNLELTGKAISFGVGALLLITAGIQLTTKKRGLKKSKDITHNDSFILGITQGLAVIPGLSRSGITVSTLLLKKFDDTTALRLSFLMSLPIVLLGNIILNMNDIATTFSSGSIFGLLTAFVFGLLTIHTLMKLSRKINFAWFVLIFAILMMLSVLI